MTSVATPTSTAGAIAVLNSITPESTDGSGTTYVVGINRLDPSSNEWTRQYTDAPQIQGLQLHRLKNQAYRRNMRRRDIGLHPNPGSGQKYQLLNRCEEPNRFEIARALMADHFGLYSCYNGQPLLTRYFPDLNLPFPQEGEAYISGVDFKLTGKMKLQLTDQKGKTIVHDDPSKVEAYHLWTRTKGSTSQENWLKNAVLRASKKDPSKWAILPQ